MDYSRQPSCPHLGSEHASIAEVNHLENVKSCANCDYSGLNLWICLHRNCLCVGCSEAVKDHSTEHFQRNNTHCVHLNLSSRRVWCYICEREVFLGTPQQARLQDPFLTGSGTTSSRKAAKNITEEINAFTFSTVESLGGLVGLQNIANTCYMNSALQALSNVLPLTNYFLNCGDLVEHTLEQTAHRPKAGLAKSYQQLIRDIWGRKFGDRDYIAPRGLLYGIRSVNSMFRGYHQHDTQEFLRCFMDQLHEELKEPRPMSPQMALACARTQHTNEQSHKKDSYTNKGNEEDTSASDSSSRNSLLSDSEYETCDSSSGGGGNSRGTGIVSESYQYEASGTFAGSKQQQYTAPTGEQRKHMGSSSPLVPAEPAVRSIISDIFDGKLLSSVQCLTCDRISTRVETFQDLSLPIPNRDHLNMLHQTHSLSAQSLNSIDSTSTWSVNSSWFSWFWNIVRSWLWGPSVTLHDCMASFFSADELKGDNMYSCEKCKKLRTGVKYSQILDLPEVLCIHLKRFRHDLSYSTKISSHVHFPLEGFDLRPYLHKDCNSRVALYQLVSVICHHGTVGGGHYTCYARNSLNNLWYEYDDQHVTEVTPEVVQNCQAYVLFYQKYNPHMELLRAEANELASASPTTHLTNDIRFYVAREWLARFNTFAEPGPINNWVMLCPHGGLLQSKIELIEQIAVPISQALWDFLYQKFGGGPAINMLYECEVCRQAAELLARRQYYELIVFKKFNALDEEELDVSAIFAISMPWLRKWQQFVHGITKKDPGPITNANIAPVMATNSADLATSAPICSVRPGSDYAQINEPLWNFLHSIYGGGPAIMLRGSHSDEQIEIIDQDEYAHEKCVGRDHLSDTESNIGQRSSLELNEGDRDRELERELECEHELESESESDRGGADDNDQQQNNDIATSSAQISNESESVSTESKRQMYLSLRESRYMGKYYGSSRKSRAGLILRNSLRKRNIKLRPTIKNTDLFGPRGCYSQHRGIDDVATQQLNAHSTEDIINSDNKGTAFNTNPSKHPQEQQQLPFPTDSAQDSQSENSNLDPVVGTVGDMRHKEYRTHSRSGRRKSRHSKEKRGITLQKFAQLHESGASTETDV